jgi:hypothetical protein
MINIGKLVGLTLVIALAMIGGISVAQTQPAATLPAAVSLPASPLTADELPDSVLHGDLLAVVVLDLKTGDKTAWNNAMMVISGGRPTTRPLGPNDPLPLGLDQSLGPFFNMGAERICVGVAVTNGNQAGTIAIRLSDGASDNLAVKWLRQNANAARIDHDGQWIVAQLDSSPAVRIGAPLSPQADDIRQDLNCWGEDVPLKILYLTSDPVRKQLMRGGPPPDAVAPMVTLFWSAKCLFIGARLGVDPKVQVRWVAPDDDGADAVIKAFAEARVKLKQPNNGTGIPLAFVQVLDQIQPVRQANVAQVSLGKKDLANVFAAVLAASMNGGGGQGQQVAQTPVAADWAPIDPAIDAASAQMRLILSAIAEYDRQNHALPAKLDDLATARLVPGPEIFHNPRTGRDSGFIYVKPDAARLADIPNPQKTAILFEEKNSKADETGLVGYADGKVAMPK